MKNITPAIATQISTEIAPLIKGGSKKSLTANLKRVLKGEDAIKVSDDIVQKYGRDFTQANVVEFVTASAPKTPAVASESKKTTSGTSKNGTIREMLSKGMSVSTIRKELNLTYQRVKNVKKAMDKIK
jgi:DNA-binding NarL/FixJ family response regulator